MRIDPRDIDLCLSDLPEAHPPGATPTSAPIVRSSLFTFPTLASLMEGLGAEHLNHVYSRGQNPTVEVLERKLAELERGEACKCFASGMAAVSAVMLGLLRSGDHVVLANHVYGPTLQLMAHLERFGIQHTYLPLADPDSVAAMIRPETKLLWVESPGTQTFRILDLPALARVARDRGVLSCIDNSWATPLLQKPLELGMDLVVHTASKYLGGHSDLMAGAVVGSAEHLQEIFYNAFLLNGGILGPEDAWLLLRGLRTLPTRLRQHEEDGLAVARHLAGRPEVARVFHPALGENAALAEAQMNGYSGLFSFELARGDFQSIRTVVDGLERFGIGVSWGGVESLVISPNRGDNAESLEAHGIPAGLIRLSVGLEGAETLIADLDQALDRLS